MEKISILQITLLQREPVFFQPGLAKNVRKTVVVSQTDTQEPKEQTMGLRQILDGLWWWMVFVFVDGLVWRGVVDGVDGVCPKKQTMGPRQIASGRCWWIVFVFVDCVVLWWMVFAQKSRPESETDSRWPMVVDGTNTVTGEDRWHRVVTSSEPARAVIPTAFFVCFVRAVLQT